MKWSCLLICVGCLDICGSLCGPIHKINALSSRFDTNSDSLAVPSSLADQEAKLLLSNSRYNGLTQKRRNLRRYGRCASKGRTASKAGKRAGKYYKHKGHIDRYHEPYNTADSSDQYEPGPFPDAKISHAFRRHRSDHHQQNIKPKHHKQYQDDYEQFPVAVNLKEPLASSNVANHKAVVEVQEAELAETDYEPLGDVDYVEKYQNNNNAERSDSIFRKLPTPTSYNGKQLSDTYYKQEEAVRPVYEQNDGSGYDERYHQAKRAFPAGFGFMYREVPVATSRAEKERGESHQEVKYIEPDYDKVIVSDYEAQYQGANRALPSVYKYKTAPVSALHTGRHRSDNDDPNYEQHIAYDNDDRYQNSNGDFTVAIHKKVPGSISCADRYSVDSHYQEDEAVEPEHAQAFASDYDERYHDANRALSAAYKYRKLPATASYAEGNRDGAYYPQKVATEQGVQKIDDIDHDRHCYDAKETVPSVPVYSKMPVAALYDRHSANVSAQGAEYGLTNYNKTITSGCDDHSQETNEALPTVSGRNKVSLVASYVDRQVGSVDAASPGHIRGNFTGFAEESKQSVRTLPTISMANTVSQEYAINCKSAGGGANVRNLAASTRNQPEVSHGAAHAERNYNANEELTAAPLDSEIPRAAFHDDRRATDVLVQEEEEVYARDPNRDHVSGSSDQTKRSGRICSDFARDNNNPIAPRAQDHHQEFLFPYAGNFQNTAIKLPVAAMNNGITHAGAASNGKSNTYGDVRDKGTAVKGKRQDNFAAYADMSHDAGREIPAAAMISDISGTLSVEGDNIVNTRSQEQNVAPDLEQESSVDYVEQPHSALRKLSVNVNVNEIPLSSFFGGDTIADSIYKEEDGVAENQEELISDYDGPSQKCVRKMPMVINTNGIPQSSTYQGINSVHANYKVGVPECQEERRASIYSEQPQNIIRELPVSANFNDNHQVSFLVGDNIVDINYKGEEDIAENQEQKRASDYAEQCQHFVSELPAIAIANEFSQASFPDVEDISDVDFKSVNDYVKTQEQEKGQDYSEDFKNDFKVLLEDVNANKIPEYLSRDGGTGADDGCKEEDSADVQEQERSLHCSEQFHNAARQLYADDNDNEIPQHYCHEDNNIEDVDYQVQNVDVKDQKREIADDYEKKSKKDVRTVREIAKKIKIPQSVSSGDFAVEKTKAQGGRIFLDQELEHVANDAEQPQINTNEFQIAAMYNDIPRVSNSNCEDSANVEVIENGAIALNQQQGNTAYYAQNYPNDGLTVSEDIQHDIIPRALSPDDGTAAEIDVPVQEEIVLNQKRGSAATLAEQYKDAFDTLPGVAINSRYPGTSYSDGSDSRVNGLEEEAISSKQKRNSAAANDQHYQNAFDIIPVVTINSGHFRPSSYSDEPVEGDYVQEEEAIASDQRQDKSVFFTEECQDAFGALPEATIDNETPLSASLSRDNAADANIQEGEAVLLDKEQSISPGHRYEDAFGALPAVAMNGEIPRAKRVKRILTTSVNNKQ